MRKFDNQVKRAYGPLNTNGCCDFSSVNTASCNSVVIDKFDTTNACVETKNKSNQVKREKNENRVSRKENQ